MSDRSQSDVIGVVLLTLIVTVTVTATGGVVLTEIQSNIGDEPLADIDSTLTADELTLEHLSGSTLAAEDVTVQIDNGDETYSLTEFDGVDDEFRAGIRASFDEIETRSGGVTVRVIHEPSQTVLHERLHDLGFPFLIGGKTGSVFMIPSEPVNYTAPDTAAVAAADESVVSVDESAKNVAGLMRGETTVTANGYTETKSVDVQVIDRDQLAIETGAVNVVGGDTVELDGELTAIGELDETDLYIRYRKQQPVTFNGDPSNNSDDVIADGRFYDSSPAGYGHAGNGYVHDNTPLLPGTNRTYRYTTDNSNAFAGTLRDREWTTTGTFGFDDQIPETDYRDLFTYNPPTDEPFELLVEYTDDGSTVNVYLEGSRVKHWDGLSGYDELYFSSYEGGASGTPRDIRAIRVPGLGAPQTELATANVDSPITYSANVTGLDPDSVYYAESYTEVTVNGREINASGEPMSLRTEGIVETLAPTNVTAESVRLRGELTTSLGDSDLSFVVVRDADDTVVADTVVETGVDTSQQFNATVSGLQQDTDYTYYARAEDSATAGSPATDTGANVRFTTDTPVITTLDVEPTGGETVDVTGKLVDLGGLDETDLYARYRKQQPVTFNGDPSNNSDDVIADGKFYDRTPKGYGHDGNGYVHDNTPLLPGTNRTYEYTTNNNNYFGGTLRDREWTTPGSFGFDDNIEETDYRADLTGGKTLPTDEPFELTVEYTEDGSTINVYLDGDQVKQWDQLAGYDELYFSSYEGGASGTPNDIRAITVPGLGPTQETQVNNTDTAPYTYTDELGRLDPDTAYFVRAHSSEWISGQYINATGETLAVQTDDP